MKGYSKIFILVSLLILTVLLSNIETVKKNNDPFYKEDPIEDIIFSNDSTSAHIVVIVQIDSSGNYVNLEGHEKNVIEQLKWFEEHDFEYYESVLMSFEEKNSVNLYFLRMSFIKKKHEEYHI